MAPAAIDQRLRQRRSLAQGSSAARVRQHKRSDEHGRACASGRGEPIA
ncbi:MAG TPA: hypothetical protein VF705_03965 [Longimicrobium sp.]|jgi:hypothetical protein